ncbi:hypothetical protein AHF37_10041 [Paragonimus kellicotti]|nr:hypothetical protein AHF37_10041 [Paragonimus kellicotti]
MWTRTLTIGSAGKTFSVTGWKLGWTVGPSNLIHAMQMHQQNTVYTCPTPMQEAVARSLELELDLLFKPESYFHEMCAVIEPKGRSMVKRLNQIGMQAVRPTGGYFLFADISKMRVPSDELETDPSVSYDVKFNNWLIQRKGVATIPMSVFYSDENKHLGSNYLRFCFFKASCCVFALSTCVILRILTYLLFTLIAQIRNVANMNRNCFDNLASEDDTLEKAYKALES